MFVILLARREVMRLHASAGFELLGSAALAYRFASSSSRPLRRQLDLGHKPIVLCKSKDKIHAARLAPRHRIIASEATTDTQQNSHTLGQRLRTWATMHETSSTEPLAASMLAGRNLATNGCRPLKMHRGR